jgi:hypothetical protein
VDEVNATGLEARIVDVRNVEGAVAVGMAGGLAGMGITVMVDVIITISVVHVNNDDVGTEFVLSMEKAIETIFEGKEVASPELVGEVDML